MIADLAGGEAGDVVLLHGCCHNPTGANLTPGAVARGDRARAAKRGVVPMIDLAYQGFGDGLEADVGGPALHGRRRCPELMLAASCSKNFGLYRDRVGAAFVRGRRTPNRRRSRRANLASLNRLNYSFPPDHGAKVVAIILGDPALRADWTAELEAMRQSMLGLRTRPRRGAAARDQLRPLRLRRASTAACSRCSARAPSRWRRCGAEHGVYMVGDSRINVAGLPAQGLDRLARGDRRRRRLMAARPLHHRGRRRGPAGLAGARRGARRGAPRPAARRSPTSS